LNEKQDNARRSRRQRNLEQIRPNDMVHKRGWKHNVIIPAALAQMPGEAPEQHQIVQEKRNVPETGDSAAPAPLHTGSWNNGMGVECLQDLGVCLAMNGKHDTEPPSTILTVRQRISVLKMVPFPASEAFFDHEQPR
jgi:hypothetical protein